MQNMRETERRRRRRMMLPFEEGSFFGEDAFFEALSCSIFSFSLLNSSSLMETSIPREERRERESREMNNRKRSY